MSIFDVAIPIRDNSPVSIIITLSVHILYHTVDGVAFLVLGLYLSGTATLSRDGWGRTPVGIMSQEVHALSYIYRGLQSPSSTESMG